jgi:hypothetical protein
MARIPDYVRATAAQWDAVRLYLERLPYRDLDSYLLGVLETVEWLQDEPVAFDGRQIMPYPPISGEAYYSARPETIAEEYLAALHDRYPERVDFVRGVLAVFDWAWNGNGRPPVDVARQLAS